MTALVLTSTDGLSHEEWLAYRRLGIGGSDVSVVCGVNKYKSPVELWLEKTGQQQPEEAGEAAYWGTKLESVIKDEFTQRTGIKVIPVKKILRSKDYSFMIANLDGVCLCPVHGKCVFEAKTANAFKAGEWEDDTVPYEYILQIQHYLCVTGYNGAYIAVLIGGNVFQWKYVPRDEEMISMIIRTERDFWALVEDDVPPPLDGSDACVKFLSKYFADSLAKSKIKLPASAADLIKEFNEAKELEDAVVKRKQKAANLLKQMLGQHEIGTIGDSYVKWQSVTQEKFSAELLKAEQPEIHAKYLVKSSHRRFTVKAAVEKPKANTATIESHTQALRKVG